MLYVPYATDKQLGHIPNTECHACIIEHAGGPLASIIVPVAEWIEVAADTSSG